MFAAFFKTSPDETERQIKIESEFALHDRMVKMLRNHSRIAWTAPPVELPSRTGVKRPLSIRTAISAVH